MTVRILNAEPAGYSQEARAILTRLGELVEEPVTQRRLAEAVRSFDVLIVRLGLRVDRGIIKAGDRLRAIVSATTGLDHIDLAAAAEQGVTVISLHGETEFLRTVPSTAEHTWALLLALLRRIPWAFESVRLGLWDRDRFRGRDLSGRRLGILGLGRVGERVASYGLAFQMNVGAYDPFRTGWTEGVERFSSLDELLRRSDVLTVHVPLSRETEGILDRERLGLLPPHAVVINTSRGAILDGAALAALLEQRRLAGAAVDVLPDEQSPETLSQQPLVAYARGHDNLLVTPHLGGASVDSMARTELFVAQKLQRFVQDQLISSLK